MSRYKKQVSLGYNQDGKRVRAWIRAETQQELKRKEKELLRNVQDELLPSVRFGEYAEKWFSTYKTSKETRTKEFYRTGLDKFTSIWGLEIAKIRRSQLQEILAQNWDHPRTCKKLAGILSQIFRAAIADGIAYRNPAEGLDLPRQTRAEKRILTTAEKKAIDAAELPPKERLFLDVIRQLGLRPEEARALTRSAFDSSARTVTISQASIFDKNAPELKRVKNSRPRTIPCPDGLFAALKTYPEQFLLFPGTDGQLMTRSTYRRFSERIFAAINSKLGGTDSINLLNGMTFYTLRHTKGTELYYLTQQGRISTKLAAQYMGHSEIMLLSKYSHIDTEKEELEVLRQAVTNL
jgi:integrase